MDEQGLKLKEEDAVYLTDEPNCSMRRVSTGTDKLWPVKESSEEQTVAVVTH